jgi:hypothetical protein
VCSADRNNDDICHLSWDGGDTELPTPRHTSNSSFYENQPFVLKCVILQLPVVKTCVNLDENVSLISVTNIPDVLYA